MFSPSVRMVVIFSRNGKGNNVSDKNENHNTSERRTSNSDPLSGCTSLGMAWFVRQLSPLSVRTAGEVVMRYS